jgi:hypothetical protein
MALGLLVVLAGCWSEGTTENGAKHDAGRAKAALVTALDAWKSGGAKALKGLNPPVRLADEDFSAGWRLTDFEIEEPDAPVNAHQDVAVILLLKDGRGKTVRREARYQVASEPDLAVLRSDH